MMKENYEFEVCANSVESCIEAQRGGANRVELCMGIPEGGTTPSYGEIKMARDVLKETRLHVIIRNRGGDFLYSEAELERMAMDIDLCRQLGVDGVVFGCLTANGDIDKHANQLLMEHAKGMNVTFHRAFDCCRDPEKALEEIITMGFHRILTSGQQPTAELGIPLLRRLNTLAKDRIIIFKIQEETQVRAFHFSAREEKRSDMLYSNPSIYMGSKGVDENIIMQTTERRVRNTIAQLKTKTTEHPLL